MSQKLIKFGKEQVPPKTALSGKSLGLHLSLFIYIKILF